MMALAVDAEPDRMLLFEHEGKGLLGRYGIPVPPGRLVRHVRDIESALADLDGPVMLKAQVLTGGRGKAGGIRSARNANDAHREAAALLGARVKELRVEGVLVERKLDFLRERYLAVLLDGEDILLLLGSKGGVEV